MSIGLTPCLPRPCPKPSAADALDIAARSVLMLHQEDRQLIAGQISSSLFFLDPPSTHNPTSSLSTAERFRRPDRLLKCLLDNRKPGLW